jgi:hypothetical protein
MSETLWWFIYYTLSMLNNAHKKLTEIFVDPWKEAVNNLYGNEITRIEEINLIQLNKVCLYSLNYLDKLFAIFGYKLSTAEQQVERVITNISKYVKNSSHLSIYLVTYGTSKCVLTRGVPTKSPPEQTVNSPKMMVVVNSSHDTTEFYKRTKGSINVKLGLLPREYAVVALICMGETQMHKLLDVLVGQDVSVTAVDAETFYEKVFKGGDTVVL